MIPKGASDSSEEMIRTEKLSHQYFINFDLEIQDFGVGIPEDKLSSLFINFNKIEEHKNLNPFGVGLGLSICKSLIEQMAGSISVESVVDQGTKFKIQFKTVCELGNKDYYT